MRDITVYKEYAWLEHICLTIMYRPEHIHERVKKVWYDLLFNSKIHFLIDASIFEADEVDELRGTSYGGFFLWKTI